MPSTADDQSFPFPRRVDRPHFTDALSPRRLARIALAAAAGYALVLTASLPAAADPNSAPPPAMGIIQEKPGNIFLEGETVSVSVEDVSGDELRWTLRNVTGEEVDRGIAPVDGGTSVVTLDPGELGYFTLDLRGYQHGEFRHDARTSVAVLASFETPADSLFGVQTHFGRLGQPDPLEIIPLLDRLGVSFVRDSVRWEFVEQEPGAYAFDPAFDLYIEELADAGIRASLTLGLFNELYDGGDTPYTASGRAAFGAYAGQIVQRYGDHLVGVEVWNEPNGQGFTRGPAARDAENYALTVESVSDAVGAIEADIPVVAGATAEIDLPWLESVFAAGALDHADAVSVHHYPSSPATHEDRMPALSQLAAQYAGGQDVPWWVTETGWPTFAPRDEDMIARDLIKLIALEAAHGAERISWFNFKNNLTPPSEVPLDRETHFGLVRSEQDPLGSLTPKPSFVTYAVLIRQLSGAVPVASETVGHGVRSELFDREDEPVRVLWAGDGNANVRVEGTGQVAVVDLMGNTATHNLPTAIPVTGAPLYLIGEVDDITAAAARSEAEELPVEVAPGTSHGVFSDAQLSGFAGTKYDATGAGDFVDYEIDVDAGGTYDIILRTKTHDSRGVYQLSVDGTPIGSEFDSYTPGNGYQLVFPGKVTFDAPGTHTVRLTAVGKRPAASGYSLALDYFDLLPADPAGPSRWEAEALQAAVSGETSRVPFANRQLSGGHGDKYNATAIGDAITYPVDVPVPGTYEIEIRTLTHPTRGVYQLSVDGEEIGDAFDSYRPDAFNRLFTLGPVTFSTPGEWDLSFTAVGQHAESSGVTLALDHIELVLVDPEGFADVEELALTSSTQQQCVAGKAVVRVAVANGDDVAAKVTVDTPFGSKTFASIAPGKTATVTFTTRQQTITGGSASVTGASLGDGEERTYAGAAGYASATC